MTEVRSADRLKKSTSVEYCTKFLSAQQFTGEEKEAGRRGALMKL